MSKRRAFVCLPGGASHVATIFGAADECSERLDVAGVSGVSAGFLVAVLLAFGKMAEGPKLLERLLQGNRVLDPGVDGDLGLCRWEVIPAIVDEVLGKGARMGDALIPLVGVVTDADRARPLYVSKRDHPYTLVSEVARASSAILPIAKMVPIPSLGTQMSPDIRLFYDGGFVDNLPDHVFDESADDAPVVSVSLDAGDDVVRVKPGQHLQQCAAVVRAITFAQGQRKTRRKGGLRITCPAVGSGLDFDLSPETIRQRIANGRRPAAVALEPWAAAH